MSVILGYLSGKLGAVAIGAAIPVIFVLLKKLIPSQLGRLLASALGKQVASIDKIEDPIRKQLVSDIALALVKLAEHELPDQGQGKAKYDLVAARLCKIIPILKGQEERIRALIEASVEALDKQLKDQIPK